MITAYFVSESKLREYTPVNKNMDSSRLISAIRISQDIVAKEALGQSLYEKLMSLVDSGDISLSGNTNYKKLLDDYIVPCCLWNAYYVSLDFTLVENTNAGLISNNTEQGSGIDLATFKTIKNSAKHTADFYTEKLKYWLINNNSLYPEYNKEDAGETLPDKSTYSTGIVFDTNPYMCRDEYLFYRDFKRK